MMGGGENKRTAQVRRKHQDLRMEQVKGIRFDSFQYELDLSRGISPKSFFHKTVTARQMKERISLLERELSARKRREAEDGRYKSELETTAALSRSYQSTGRQRSEIEASEANPTDFDNLKRRSSPMKT